MNHGTISSYHRGCGCKACKQAKSAQMSSNGRKPRLSKNRELLREVLQELLPFGLTNDCPARALEKTLAEPSTTAGANQPASSRASRRTA